jgi:hypothetical protein
MKSRVNREVHARFCESLGVKFPGATRPPGTFQAVARGGFVGLCVKRYKRSEQSSEDGQFSETGKNPSS